MPGIFDMPLDKLATYQGRNPRPDDHDAFWDAAIAEMHAVDPQVELRPAPFKSPHAECFDLYFTGVRGARVHAKYLRPKQVASPCPAVCQFHGYSGSSGDWLDKLAWVASGFCIAALDCRGQGGLSEDSGSVKGTTHHGHIIRGLADGPENLLFRHIYLDTAQLARIVMSFDEVDDTRVGAFGGSQGGGLTLACASLEPKIKRAASQYPFLCDYQRVWEMDLPIHAYTELRTFFRHHDPEHTNEAEWFRRLGYIDMQHLTHRIKATVLMGVGLLDQVCPPSTQFAAYNRITSPKSTAIYPDFAHENLPGWNDKVHAFMLGM